MYRFRPEFVKFHLRRTLNRFLEDEDQFIVDDDCKAVMIEVIEELGLKFVKILTSQHEFSNSSSRT